jgi:hypothetical protein
MKVTVVVYTTAHKIELSTQLCVEIVFGRVHDKNQRIYRILGITELQK